MHTLLRLSTAIDALNRRVGHAARWFVLVAVLVSAGNAVARYLFGVSSNAWLELQWYLVAATFLLCAGYAMAEGAHVRVDVLYARTSRRTQLWIEVFGTLVFLLPMAGLIAWLAWPVFVTAFRSGEMSGNTGGLVLWWARALVPLGFGLLFLQGLAELVKRIAILRGVLPDPADESATDA